MNDRRRHLDTSERLAVAAREQLAAQSNGAPRPTTAEVAASMGVSERHYQRAKARERERQGLPQPLGGQRGALSQITRSGPECRWRNWSKKAAQVPLLRFPARSIHSTSPVSRHTAE